MENFSKIVYLVYELKGNFSISIIQMKFTAALHHYIDEFINDSHSLRLVGRDSKFS